MQWTSALQITARQNAKNQAPTYWPVVLGEKFEEKTLSMVLSLLKVIIVLILMLALGIAMLGEVVDIPSMVVLMPEVEGIR
jgi:hypothetical protein